METRLPCRPTRGSLTSPSYLARNRTLGPPLENNPEPPPSSRLEGAGNAGTVTVRLLKTSNQNALLMAAYNAQRISSSLWGKNVITLVQSNADDAIVCAGCAFVCQPNLEYATDGGIMTWTFHSGKITGMLGEYK